jgi:hypothetical protein
VRGEAPDLIVIDEAAFMPAKQFTDNVLPILGNNNRAMIAISTPGDDANWYSQVLNVLVESISPFRIIAKQLACIACRSLNRDVQCNHNKHLLPAYKNPEVTRIQKIILPENVYMAEVQGIITATGTKLIDAKTVQKLRERVPYTFKSTKVIWIGVDPSGGSQAGSRMALVAIAINTDSHFVVSLVSCRRVGVVCGRTL